MDNELRVGIVGTGMIGRSHIERISRRLHRCRVSAVADVNTSVARQMADEYDCTLFEKGEELIKAQEVDAVIVSTIDDYHEQYATAAINASKFVFCEKPLAPRSDGVRRIMDAEIEGGHLLVQIGFMRRYDVGYQQLKAMIDTGAYGDPLMVHCAHRNPSVTTEYVTSMAVENSMIHEIDVLRWLLNDEFTTAQVVFPKRTRHAHAELQDPQIMYLTTEQGVRIDVEAFVNCQYGYDIKCEVCCEEGILSLPVPASPTVVSNGWRGTKVAGGWSERFVDAYDRELQNWIDSTLRGQVDGPNSWDAYAASVTATAASESRDRREVVGVELPAQPDLYRRQ